MKNNVDKQYLEALQYILDNGELKEDRTGTGTLSIFDYTMTFDMSEGFPLLTSKKVFTKAVIHELIWFLRGDTNIKYLVDNGVNIWNGDAYKFYINNWKPKEDFKVDINNEHLNQELVNERPLSMDVFIHLIKTDEDFAKKWGELGPVYGKQWRRFGGTEKKASGWEYGTPNHFKEVNKGDQIKELVDNLKNNPDSRRLIVNAWNVSELDEMVLPPCHFAFQCYTSKLSLEQRQKWYAEKLGKNEHYVDELGHDFLTEKGVPERKLDLKWFQRSVDGFLGLPFNIASYAILLHLLTKETNMVPNRLIFNGGDFHIYLNHIEQCKLQIKSKTYKLPKLVLKNDSIFNIKFEDIEIVDYESSPVIKAPLSN
jgi:thymidylate synthase